MRCWFLAKSWLKISISIKWLGRHTSLILVCLKFFPHTPCNGMNDISIYHAVLVIEWFSRFFQRKICIIRQLWWTLWKMISPNLTIKVEVWYHDHILPIETYHLTVGSLNLSFGSHKILHKKLSLIFFIFIAINIFQKILKVLKKYPINQVKLSTATNQNDQNLKVIRFSG